MKLANLSVLLFTSTGFDSVTSSPVLTFVLMPPVKVPMLQRLIIDANVLFHSRLKTFRMCSRLLLGTHPSASTDLQLLVDFL